MVSETLLCVVYDKVAREHGPIFEAKSDAIAKRIFGNLMKDTPNPDDFALVVVRRFVPACLTRPAFPGAFSGDVR